MPPWVREAIRGPRRPDQHSPTVARVVAILPALLWAGAASAGATSKPDPVHGKQFADPLCTNCHLVGSATQEQANPDVPSLPEIANLEGQTAGAIIGRIILPKHPMPQNSAHQESS